MDWAQGHGPAGPMEAEVRDATGAILAGRQWHDVAMERHGGRAGIYGGQWGTAARDAAQQLLQIRQGGSLAEAKVRSRSVTDARPRLWRKYPMSLGRKACRMAASV